MSDVGHTSSLWGAVFVLPQSVIKAVDKSCREFLWGGTNYKRKIALVAWTTVCLSKRNGGLNVKDCKKWNVASVGKLLWQVSVNKEMLWVKWVCI